MLNFIPVAEATELDNTTLADMEYCEAVAKAHGVVSFSDDAPHYTDRMILVRNQFNYWQGTEDCGLSIE